jgi:autotransporter adhesin
MNIGKRRITGVSAGSQDDDAANIAQLRAIQVNSLTAITGVGNRSVNYDFKDANGNGIFDAGEEIV